MRLLVSKEVEWEAGLSAFENTGRCPPRAAALRLRMATRVRRIWSRLLLFAPPCRPTSSRTKETPRTVTPCSLARVAAAARREARTDQPCLLCTRRVRRKKTADKISALPTIPATASLWIGWVAKSKDAVKAVG